LRGKWFVLFDGRFNVIIRDPSISKLNDKRVSWIVLYEF
jgi:hypothetical protein